MFSLTLMTNKPEKEIIKVADLGQRLYVRNSAMSLIVRWSHVYKT